MKSFLVIMMLTILFSKCNKKPKSIDYEDIILNNDLALFDEGKALILHLGTELEPTSTILTRSQLKVLKNIILKSAKFSSSDILKKCRFEEDIKIILSNTVNKKLDKLEILFCRACKTWELRFRGIQYRGDYIEKEVMIDKFIEEFDYKPRVTYLLGDKEKDESKQIFGNSLYNHIVKQRIDGIKIHRPKNLSAILFDDEGNPYDTKSIDLNAKQIDMLYPLLIKPDLYNQQKGIRMCDRPISYYIQILNEERESTFTLYISDGCNQVVIKTDKEGITLSCPKLIKKLNHLFKNLSL